jgi:hypothetical protein
VRKVKKRWNRCDGTYGEDMKIGSEEDSLDLMKGEDDIERRKV